MKRFKKGDIVRLKNLTRYPEWNGEETTLLSDYTVGIKTTNIHGDSIVMDGYMIEPVTKIPFVMLWATQCQLEYVRGPREWTGEKKIMDMFIPALVTEDLV